MDQAVSSIRMEHWKALIMEAGASGMTRKDWCREHGIPLRQYYYWQKKIREEALTQLQSVKSAGTLPTVTTPQLPSGFVELSMPSAEIREVPDKGAPYPDSLTESFHPGLILETGKARLLIGDDVSEKTLQTVMRVMLHA